jgi:hypothetical protein
MSQQQINPGAVITPTQLLAAALVLVLGSVGILITGASVVTTPSWVPAMLGVGAVAIIPVTLGFVYRLLTKHRRQLVNDELYAQAVGQASASADQLDQSLTAAGVDITALVSGQADINDEIKDDLAKLLAVVSRLEDERGDRPAIPLEALLTAANGLMAAHRWTEAARYFDMYVAQVQDNWEVQYTRGVAHANTRGGIPANVTALRAYNEAIAFAPLDTNPNIMARLFAYRGAIAKRLNRLGQAEHDLLLARTMATARYELGDIAYNLACVYAMTSRKQETLNELRALREFGRLEAVHAHLDDYFRTLRDDPDFRREAGLRQLTTS